MLQVLLGYLAISALVGLALTYYFDNPGNAKLMTILQVGLQLGGLLLVALSTALPEASLTLCCLLVAWQLYPAASSLWQRYASILCHHMCGTSCGCVGAGHLCDEWQPCKLFM